MNRGWEIRRLLQEGLTSSEAAKRLGISRGHTSYHARRLRDGKALGQGITQDWAEVQTFYDLGHSAKECGSHFGFSKPTWTSAVKRGRVIPRAPGIPLDEVLVPNRVTWGRQLKIRLLRAGLLENKCYECGLLPVWFGEPLVLILDHVNGDHSDNRLENLRLICPNCDSQSVTFAGRNRGRQGAVTESGS